MITFPHRGNYMPVRKKEEKRAGTQLDMEIMSQLFRPLTKNLENSIQPVLKQLLSCQQHWCLKALWMLCYVSLTPAFVSGWAQWDTPSVEKQQDLRIQEVCCVCVQVCVSVKQYVTSRKLLSADLHSALLFPLIARVTKQAGVAKQRSCRRRKSPPHQKKERKKKRKCGAAEPPVAGIKVQKCKTKGSVIRRP